MLVVNALAETGRVDDREGNTDAVLLKLNIDGLDLNLTLNVSVGSSLLGKAGVDLGARVLGVLEDLLSAVGEQGLLDESVNESSAASAGGACDVSMDARLGVRWVLKVQRHLTASLWKRRPVRTQA